MGRNMKDIIIVDIPTHFAKEANIYVIKDGESPQAIPVDAKPLTMLARAVDLAYSKEINTIQVKECPIKDRIVNTIKTIEQNRYSQNKIEVI